MVTCRIHTCCNKPSAFSKVCRAQIHFLWTSQNSSRFCYLGIQWFQKNMWKSDLRGHSWPSFKLELWLALSWVFKVLCNAQKQSCNGVKKEILLMLTHCQINTSNNMLLSRITGLLLSELLMWQRKCLFHSYKPNSLSLPLSLNFSFLKTWNIVIQRAAFKARYFRTHIQRNIRSCTKGFSLSVVFKYM